MLYVLLFAAIAGTLGQVIDKHLVNIGISRKDYFYYMCLSMIPYSFFMLVIESLQNGFYFNFNIVVIILLILAMIFRYIKQHTIVGCLTHLNPYEDSAYLTLGIVLAFIIDLCLNIVSISMISILSIFLILIGVFLVADSKIKLKHLKKDLAIRIITSLIISYITYFLLQNISNALYLFIVNLALTIIFSKSYTMKYHKQKKEIVKWVFIQQLCGFLALYLSNILISNSVTLSSYVRPTTLCFLLLVSLFLGKSKKPNIKQIIGIITIITGTILVTI